MPGAANLIADAQPLCQRTAVVAAGSADSKHLIAAASDQDCLAAGVTEHHATVRELGKRNSLRQVWTRERAGS